jgi:glycosyltransferase involved in cell wall biosynthesis
MSEAWAIAVPSTMPDPFPNVVLEAMAEGRAVVGTTLGGIPEMVIAGETGELVRPGDVAALANALERVLGDRSVAQSMGSAGRAHVARTFSRDGWRTEWRRVVKTTFLPVDSSVTLGVERKVSASD